MRRIQRVSITTLFSLALLFLGTAGIADPIVVGVAGDLFPVTPSSLTRTDEMAKVLSALNGEFARLRYEDENAKKKTLDEMAQKVSRMANARRAFAAGFEALMPGMMRKGLALFPAGRRINEIASEPVPEDIRLQLYFINRAMRQLEGAMEQATQPRNQNHHLVGPGRKFQIRFFPDTAALMRATKKGEIGFALMSGQEASLGNAHRNLRLLVSAGRNMEQAANGHAARLPTLGIEDPALSVLKGYAAIKRLKKLIPADLWEKNSDMKKDMDLDDDIQVKTKLLDTLRKANADVENSLRNNPDIDEVIPSRLDRQRHLSALALASRRSSGEKWKLDYELRRQILELGSQAHSFNLRLTEDGMKKLVQQMRCRPVALGMRASQPDFLSLALLDQKFAPPGQRSHTGFAASGVMRRGSRTFPLDMVDESKAISMEGGTWDSFGILPPREQSLPRIPAAGIWFRSGKDGPPPEIQDVLGSLPKYLTGFHDTLDVTATVFGVRAFSPQNEDHYQQYLSQMQDLRRALKKRPDLVDLASRKLPENPQACETTPHLKSRLASPAAKH